MLLGLSRYFLNLLLGGSHLGENCYWAVAMPFLDYFFPLMGCSFWFSLQLPRLYNVYKEMGIVQSFETILENVFTPLFEVTVDPASHPKLHVLLTVVSEIHESSNFSLSTFSIYIL